MSKLSFSQVRVVLINTSHPGNIGSAARALKTMGLSQLYLVSPKYFPHTKATELAAGADDILEQATVCNDIKQALHGCRLVIGTSSRPRGIPTSLITPRECGEKITSEMQSGEVAILFGNEQSGLSNEELQYCHYHTIIPSNTNYCSLNLAAAVQILCYEIRMASLDSTPLVQKFYDDLANSDEVESFFKHLETLLIEIDFLRPTNPKRLLSRLKRLFNRIRLEKMEVNLLHGILTAIQKQHSLPHTPKKSS
ncbi:MAG: RNA methyltransferase [Gammaproteobacteria bacterium]